MHFLRPLALVLAVMVTAGAAYAHEFQAGDLELDHPWIAEPPPGAPTAAGYLAITNEGEEADRLMAIRCAFAEKCEIHEMTIDDAGVMQMRALPEGIEIAPGTTVKLARGGYHLMFTHVAERPVAGDMIPVTLVFEHAGEVDVMFSVQKAGTQDDDHMDMDMNADETMEMDMEVGQ